MPDDAPERAMSVRFPPEIHDRLAAEAKARGVSVNWLVTKLVEENLDRLIPADKFRLTKENDRG